MSRDQMKKMMMLIESCSCESNKEELDESASMSAEQLAHVSDEALDNAYHYGRSSPGNSFGWQANVKSAEFAKRAIEAGETDIEAISDAIHKGWNVTAKAFVENPDQFGDTEKLRAAGKLEAKLAQREKLMNIEYAQLPEDEKEKDRVVARALYKAIKGEELGQAASPEGVDEDFDVNAFIDSIYEMAGTNEALNLKDLRAAVKGEKSSSEPAKASTADKKSDKPKADSDSSDSDEPVDLNALRDKAMLMSEEDKEFQSFMETLNYVMRRR